MPWRSPRALVLLLQPGLSAADPIVRNVVMFDRNVVRFKNSGGNQDRGALAAPPFSQKAGYFAL